MTSPPSDRGGSFNRLTISRLLARLEAGGDWSEIERVLSERTDGERMWCWGEREPWAPIMATSHHLGVYFERFLQAPRAPLTRARFVSEVDSWGVVVRVRRTAPLHPVLSRWGVAQLSEAARRHSMLHPLLVRACRLALLPRHEPHDAHQLDRDICQVELDHAIAAHKLYMRLDLPQEPWRMLDQPAEALVEIERALLLSASNALLSPHPYQAAWTIAQRLALAELCMAQRQHGQYDAAQALALMEDAFEREAQALHRRLFETP